MLTAPQLNNSTELNYSFEGALYEQSYGLAWHAIKDLLEDGRKPLSMLDIMKRRLDVFNGEFSDTVRSAWNHKLGTADISLHDGQGNIKFIPDAQLLRELDPAKVPFYWDGCRRYGYSKIYGEYRLDEGIYESLPGTLFTRSDLARHSKSLRKEEVLDSPLWNAFAQNDQATLKAYTDLVFKDFPPCPSREALIMYAGTNKPCGHPTARVWELDRMGLRGSAATEKIITKSIGYSIEFIGEKVRNVKKTMGDDELKAWNEQHLLISQGW